MFVLALASRRPDVAEAVAAGTQSATPADMANC
jgi:hypothetical protein